MNRRNFMKLVGAMFIAPTIVPQVKPRQLKAVWSYEAQQDLRQQHNAQAEAELMELLAHELNFEIDREVLRNLAA